MVKPAVFMVMALVQSLATTYRMKVGVKPSAVVPAPCPVQDTACTRVDLDEAGKTEIGAAGPITASLPGLLVLGVVIGRRKSGLSEVVS